MKRFFFPRLAWTGIRKNRRLYLPYVLSCIGMIAMFCILHNLSVSPSVSSIKAGNNLQLVLGLGQFVIAFFALLFLFYTNSFLIRRRYKEFGLYNILGMDKGGIGRVVFWEALIVAAISLGCGLALGELLSKLAELGLLNAIHAPIDYGYTFSWKTIRLTALLFGAIFVVLFFRSLIQVHRTKPLELLRSENTGEKAPKANWLFAVLGFVILAAAYVISVSIRSPMTAIMLFFVAVLMVILATYLLFIAGSVALCKLLQKNKRFYYQKQNFVSVSSMVFRMKRNGAGLGSICILCTMVLVIITSTTSLYFGADESLKSRYPFELTVQMNYNDLTELDEGKGKAVDEGCREVLAENGAEPVKDLSCSVASIAALQIGNEFFPDVSQSPTVLDYESLRSLYFVSQAEYNEIMGTDIKLEPNEAMVYASKMEYEETSVVMGDLHLTVVGTLDEFIPMQDANAFLLPSLMLVVPDYETLRPAMDFTYDGELRSLELIHYYGVDTGLDDETNEALDHELFLYLDSLDWGGNSYLLQSRAENHEDFYITYGGLFFLGIVLSIVFLFAAAMILYYKQISEGYEDQARFAIMRKVGMTKKDIRKSVNAQVLTVFFAPLILAGIHLVFAFPLVWKLLQMFSLFNLRFVILVTALSFLAFAALYAILYKLTARAYYGIVSADE